MCSLFWSDRCKGNLFPILLLAFALSLCHVRSCWPDLAAFRQAMRPMAAVLLMVSLLRAFHFPDQGTKSDEKQESGHRAQNLTERSQNRPAATHRNTVKKAQGRQQHSSILPGKTVKDTNLSRKQKPLKSDRPDEEEQEDFPSSL